MQAPSSPDPLAQTQTPRRTTASSLLAKFLPGVRTQHKMDTQRADKVLRPKTPVQYAESESSSAPTETPPSQRLIDLSEDYEEDEIQIPQPSPPQDEETIEYAPPSRSRAGLRTRKPNNSLKAAENGFYQLVPARSKSSKKNGAGADINGINVTPVVSKRVAIRQEIASKTAKYRNQFLIDKKDFWLPLLPPYNYLKKLVDQHEQLSPAELADLPTVTPYAEIDRQPRGVTAVMKPYQLSGLSFMVYLHRNVSTLHIRFEIEADYNRACLESSATKWVSERLCRPFRSYNI
jgi:SWI/SNF-related matrix-associated actin-dependent regulator of chromatin subfamily A member 5